MRRTALITLALTLLMSVQALAPLAVRAEGESDPLWNQPSFDKKIFNIGQRILAANGITERISFVYDRKHVRNAYAVRQGGNAIVVYKDLLGLMDSDDELAAVLSHEIAHIIKRHHNRYTPTRVGFAIATTALVFAMGAAGSSASEIAAMPNFYAKPDVFTQRKLEKEADLVGLGYMVKAGYNPLAMETFMNKLVGDAGPVTRFFADHPVGTDRLQYIHTAIVTNYPQFLTPATRDNLVPGSPYQVQATTPTVNTAPQAVIAAKPDINGPATANGSAPVRASTPSLTAQNESTAARQELYTQLNTILHPAAAATPPIAALMTATEPNPTTNSPGSTTPLVPPPAKISYHVPNTSKLKSQTSKKGPAHTADKSVPDGTTHTLASATTVAAPPTISVAQALLELSPESLRLVKLVSQRGLLTRDALNIEFEALDEDLLNAMLLDLQNNKKLITIQGTDDETTYVLTPRAARVLRPN